MKNNSSNGIYVCIRAGQRKNAIAKIGMTERPVNKRISELKKMKLVYFIHTPNATKAERLVVESYVRLYLERAGYKQIGNDHFTWSAKNIKKEYQIFCDIAKNLILKGCEQFDIDYDEH